MGYHKLRHQLHCNGNTFIPSSLELAEFITAHKRMKLFIKTHLFIFKSNCLQYSVHEPLQNKVTTTPQKKRENDFTIYWIQYDFTVFRDFTLDPLSRSRTHYDFIVFSAIYNDFTIYFANSLWIEPLFRELTIVPLYFRELTMNSLYFRGLIINSLTSLRIQYLFRKLLMIPLSAYPIHLKSMNLR